MGLDDYLMTLSITNSIALNNLCALPVHPSFALNHWQPQIFLSSPEFCLFQNVRVGMIQDEAFSESAFYFSSFYYFLSQTLFKFKVWVLGRLG